MNKQYNSQHTHTKISQLLKFYDLFPANIASALMLFTLIFKNWGQKVFLLSHDQEQSGLTAT